MSNFCSRKSLEFSRTIESWGAKPLKIRRCLSVKKFFCSLSTSSTPITLLPNLRGTESSDLLLVQPVIYLWSKVTSLARTGWPVKATQPQIPSSPIFSWLRSVNFFCTPLAALNTKAFFSSSTRNIAQLQFAKLVNSDSKIRSKSSSIFKIEDRLWAMEYWKETSSTLSLRYS